MPKSAPKKIKKSQRGVRFSRQVRLGVWVLIFLLLLITVGKFLNFIGSLSLPFAPDSQTDLRGNIWQKDEPLSLVVEGKETYFLSLDLIQGNLTLIKVPEESSVNVPFGYGNWPIRSVYGLGQSEQPPFGARLLSQTVSSLFGLPVNGYLLFPEKSNNLKAEDIIQKARSNPLNLFSIVRQSRTNLSLKEYISFWWNIRKIRSDKIEVIDLGESSVSSWKNLADGSRVLTLDQFKIDALAQKKFEDTKIKDEGLTIGIFNTTDHPGLAERASRLITNMGGRVVFTTNLDSHLENSLVTEQSKTTTNKISYTLARIRGIFVLPTCQKVNAKSPSKCMPSGFKYQQMSADINVFLGEDFYLRYNKR